MQVFLNRPIHTAFSTLDGTDKFKQQRKHVEKKQRKQTETDQRTKLNVSKHWSQNYSTGILLITRTTDTKTLMMLHVISLFTTRQRHQLQSSTCARHENKTTVTKIQTTREHIDENFQLK